MDKELSSREQLTLEKIKQETARAAAQTEAALAEAEDFRSNAIKNIAEAEQTKVQTRQDLLDLEEAEQKRKEELASNKYYKKYNFTSAVDSKSSQELMNQLTLWSRQEPGCDIEIVFSSPGGSVIDGMALFDFISNLRAQGHKVTTGAIGYAASMAGILLQAGNVRWLGRESYILIHEVSFGCVAPETKALKADLTYASVADLKVGDTLLSFDEFPTKTGSGNGRAYRKATVTLAEPQWAARYRITFESGEEVIAAEGHPWLVKGDNAAKWLRTRNLNINTSAEKKSHIMRLLPSTEIDASRDAGYIAGLYNAEGCLARAEGKGFELGFTQIPGQIMEDVKKWLEANQFSYGSYVRPASEKSQPCERVRINGGLPEVFRFLALTRPSRLIEQWKARIENVHIRNMDWEPVRSIECIGEGEVIRLETSTGTFIAGGAACHNAGGKIGEVEDEVKFVKKIQERVIKIFASRCADAGKNGTADKPLSANQLKEKWSRRDWWISSDEAISWGLIDEVR